MANPQQESKKKANKGFRFSRSKYVGLPVLALLVFLMAKSKDMYETIFSSWFETCRVVIDVDYTLKQYMPINNANEDLKRLKYYTNVQLYSFGQVPPQINLHFKSTNGLLQLVKFQDPLLGQNLLEHEWSGQECPIVNNSFCQRTLAIAPINEVYGTKFSDLHIRISDFNAELDPIFEVYLHDDNVNANNFKVFLQQPIQDSNRLRNTNPSCRVEVASWKNFWVWGNDWLRILYLFGLFLLLGVLAGWIKNKQGANSDE
jgi:hypothetical protein